MEEVSGMRSFEMQHEESVSVHVMNVPWIARGSVKWSLLHRSLEFRGEIQVGNSHKIMAGVWTRIRLWNGCWRQLL